MTRIALGLVLLIGCSSTHAQPAAHKGPAFGATATTTKVLTCATATACADLRVAIFKSYRAAELARRGAVELDVYRGNGQPLPVQVTTAYVGPPPPKYADPAAPTAKELSDYAAISQVQLEVDATVEAMQGQRIDIGAGKQVTIDVTAATVAAAAAAK